MSIGPGLFHPLSGKPPKIGKRLLVPAALATLAAALLFAAPAVFNARVADATETALTELRELEPAADRVAALRERATVADTLVRESIIEPTQDWQSVLPVLTEVQRAVGPDAYLFRLDLDAATVSIRGDAPSAAVTPMLERLVESPVFDDAALVAPTTVGTAPDRVSFEVRATRAVPTRTPANGGTE